MRAIGPTISARRPAELRQGIEPAFAGRAFAAAGLLKQPLHISSMMVSIIAELLRQGAVVRGARPQADHRPEPAIRLPVHFAENRRESQGRAFAATLKFRRKTADMTLCVI